MIGQNLEAGTRVTLEQMTYCISRILPREVDPMVYSMTQEDPGNVTFEDIGGLVEQIRLLKEVIELPILNPSLFLRVGIKPPRGCLLYGPPGIFKIII